MQENQIPVAPIIFIIFAIIAVVLFAGMIIFFIFLFSRAAKRRSYDTSRGQQMQQAAGQIGFSYQAQAPVTSLAFFSGYELYEGVPVSIENLMTGRINGDNASVFDLVFRNAGGAVGYGSRTSRQTMYVLTSNHLALPEFHLRPEGISEKVLPEFSRVDIDFLERPVFSDRYLLYGKDETAIRRLFSLQNLDFFEKNQNLCIFGRGNCLFLHQSKTLSSPQQISQYFQFLAYIRDLFRQ